MKFGLELVKISSRKEKVLITDLFNPYCDRETSNATQKKKILEADVAKHSTLEGSRRQFYHFGQQDFGTSVGAGCFVEEAVTDGHHS